MCCKNGVVAHFTWLISYSIHSHSNHGHVKKSTVLVSSEVLAVTQLCIARQPKVACLGSAELGSVSTRVRARWDPLGEVVRKPRFFREITQ